MADSSADFALRLTNQFSRPAREMSNSARQMQADMRATQRVFAQGETDFQKKLKERRRLQDRAHGQELRDMRERKSTAEKSAAVAMALQDKLAAAAKRTRDAEERRRRNAADRLAERRDVGFHRRAIRQREAERKARGEALRLEGLGSGSMLGGSAGMLGGPAGMAVGFLKAGLVAAVTAAAALAAAMGAVAAKFTSATLAAVDFGQRSKTALTSILKDGTLAAQQFGEVRREAGAMGLDVMGTVDQFKMLANSGFQVPMARELVRMSADLQALTGSSESAQFALRAISQIKMKGRLQAEEITGQLAEHGVSADEVYKVLGKTLGKTREEILKMQKAGDLSADVAIPAILQAVRNQLGVEKSGGFAMKINASSIGGMWRTLKGQVQNAFISLGERVEPGVTRAFQSIMASIQKAVASPQMVSFTNAIVGMFNTLSEFAGSINFAQLLTDAARVLGNELVAAATFVRDNGAALRENFVRFVEAMGTGLKMAVDFFKPFMDFAASDFVRFMVTPLDETKKTAAGTVFNEDGSIKTKEQRDVAAGRAGAAMGGNKSIDVKFGDLIFQGSAAASPSQHADQLTSEVRRQMMAMLKDV
jgi:tape measure domain-containing protein